MVGPDLRRLQLWEPWLILPAGLLLLLGMLTVYSATALSMTGGSGLALRHAASIVVGLLVAGMIVLLPTRAIEDLSPMLYAVMVALLLLVLVAGDVSSGARRWLVLGPVRFQPAEPAKVAMILFLGRYLARPRCDLDRIWSLGGALAIIGLPFLLVLKEPDLGTAGAFVASGLGMLVWAGLPWIWLLVFGLPILIAVLSRTWWLWIPLLAVSGLILRRFRLPWLVIGIYVALNVGVALEAPRLYNGLEPYQRARLSSFANPEREPTGAGYQVIQSKIAIGSGGLWGQGYGRGSQKAMAFLPRQHTDFIYSVIGEEWGFLGALLVLLLFGILLVRGLALARIIRSRFGSVVGAGVVSLLFYHTGVNVAMTLGMAPVTGLPLPFISFGGSFMVTTLAAAGLLWGVSIRRRER